MTDQFARQAEQMMNAAKEARIPENVQAFAEDSVAKSREVYAKMSTATADGYKAMQEVMLAAQAGAQSVGEKVLANASANTEAAFDAAQAMAQAKTMPEMARLQADFFQQQMATASAQTKEFFELSNKIGRQTLESMNAAATKSFEQMKTGG